MNVRKSLIDAIFNGEIIEDDIPEALAVKILARQHKRRGCSYEQIRRKFTLKSRMQVLRMVKQK